jgi:hypothetical protein
VTHNSQGIQFLGLKTPQSRRYLEVVAKSPLMISEEANSMTMRPILMDSSKMVVHLLNSLQYLIQQILRQTLSWGQSIKQYHLALDKILFLKRPEIQIRSIHRHQPPHFKAKKDSICHHQFNSKRSQSCKKEPISETLR